MREASTEDAARRYWRAGAVETVPDLGGGDIGEALADKCFAVKNEAAWGASPGCLVTAR